VSLRWSDYVLARGDEDVAAVWAAGAKDGNTLYIIGEGFDPRSLLGLERLIAVGVHSELSVISLGLAPPGSTSVRAEVARQHVARLEALAAEGALAHARVAYPEKLEESRSVGRLLFGALYELPQFQDAGHIVIDISALPTSVYFALIAGVLDMVRQARWGGELQVVVAENAAIDSFIRSEGPDVPAAISRFKFEVELDPRAERPVVVWAPILGEGALAQLETLQQVVAPDEVCPVLPFPARNPRRADELLVELRGFLIDALDVEPGNYIYADESNPFDLYRGLSRLHERYRQALRPLGEAAIVLSIHSSKTLSLGALLAAYEHEMPVLNASAERHYEFDPADVSAALLAETELATLWLAGTPTT
jgi:hypothetical protein